MLEEIPEYSNISELGPAVIYEGALLRYRPGVANQFLERWCVLTPTEFRYYKTKWHSLCWPEKPIGSVPVFEIS
jgi:hypothetical protein